jgi:hypothetical protein
MGERRESMIERMVHRIEEHIEDWRRRDAARAAEAEANRDQLWAAAAERERFLVEMMGEQKADRSTLEEVARDNRVAFVVHTEEVADVLESFANARMRLVRAIPASRGSYAKEMSVKGSWLVFEEDE